MKYTFHDVDERIIKTRLALSGAIFEVIKKCPNVKVLEICKQADVTPMTYYHHFGNKTQLLEFAVKNQLQNILPIPKKLKPVNMRQLIAYLLKSFILFFKENHDLILISINNLLLKGYKNSYIHILLNYIRVCIYDEIKIVAKNEDQIFSQIWSNLITYSLFFGLINNKATPQPNQFSIMWNSIKQLRINL